MSNVGERKPPLWPWIVLVVAMGFTAMLWFSYQASLREGGGVNEANGYTYNARKWLEGRPEVVERIVGVAESWGGHSNGSSGSARSGLFGIEVHTRAAGFEREEELDWALALAPHGIPPQAQRPLSVGAAAADAQLALAQDLAKLAMAEQTLVRVDVAGRRVVIDLQTKPLAQAPRDLKNGSWPLFPHESNAEALYAGLRAWVAYRTPSLAGYALDLCVDQIALRFDARGQLTEARALEVETMPVCYGEVPKSVPARADRSQAMQLRWQLAAEGKLPKLWAAPALLRKTAFAAQTVLETATATGLVQSATLALVPYNPDSLRWRMRTRKVSGLDPEVRAATTTAQLEAQVFPGYQAGHSYPVLTVEPLEGASLTAQQVATLSVLVGRGVPSRGRDGAAIYDHAAFVETADGVILNRWRPQRERALARLLERVRGRKRLDVLVQLGDVTFASGQADRARTHYCAAVREEPKWPAYAAHRSLCKAGMAAEAAAVLAEVAAKRPRDMRVAAERAHLAWDAGRLAEAMDIVLGCLGAPSEASMQASVSAAWQLVRMVLSDKELATTVREGLRQRAQSSADGRFHAALACVQAAVGEHEAARMSMQEAVDRSPALAVSVDGKRVVPSVWATQEGDRSGSSRSRILGVVDNKILVATGTGDHSLLALDAAGTLQPLTWSPYGPPDRGRSFPVAAHVTSAGHLVVADWRSRSESSDPHSVRIRAFKAHAVWPPLVWDLDPNTAAGESRGLVALSVRDRIALVVFSVSIDRGRGASSYDVVRVALPGAGGQARVLERRRFTDLSKIEPSWDGGLWLQREVASDDGDRKKDYEVLEHIANDDLHASYTVGSFRPSVTLGVRQDGLLARVHKGELVLGPTWAEPQAALPIPEGLSVQDVSFGPSGLPISIGQIRSMDGARRWHLVFGWQPLE